MSAVNPIDISPLTDEQARNAVRLAEYRAKRALFDLLVKEMRRAVEHLLRDIHDEALVEAAIAAGRRAMERRPSDSDLVELGIQAAMMRAYGPGGDAA